MVTRQNLKDVKEALDPHLTTLAEKLGLQLKWGSGRYGEDGGTLKIEIAALSADGHAMTPEARAFELYCGRVGLEKEDLWGEFTTPRDGKTYQIVGFNVRAPLMPLLCKNLADGKGYKFRAETFTRNAPKITRKPAATAG